MTKRTTIRLPVDLLDSARRKAAAEGCTLTCLIEDGLRLTVAESRKAAKGAGALPPISSSTGGVMPGMDVADLSAMQDTDDLDHVDRRQQFK
jgi:hypothetical protein